LTAFLTTPLEMPQAASGSTNGPSSPTSIYI
jgi:hypothetical protein